MAVLYHSANEGIPIGAFSKLIAHSHLDLEPVDSLESHRANRTKDQANKLDPMQPLNTFHTRTNW